MEDLGRLKSSSSKERTAALESVRDIFSHNLRNSNLDSLSDRTFRDIFEAIFHVASVERASFLESTRTQVRQAAGRRLELCAGVLRLAVEISLIRIEAQSVSVVIDHIIQTAPAGESGYCEPLTSNYLKSLRILLQHPAHVEHMSKDLWNRTINFCIAGLEHTENESGTSLSFGSYARTASGTAEVSIRQSPATSMKPAARSESHVHLGSRDIIELITCIRLLVSAQNSPIEDSSAEIVHSVLSFLASIQDKGSLSKATNAHNDAFATICTVLARSRNDNGTLVRDVLKDLIPIIKALWTAKESSLNQEILVCLVYTLDYIPALLKESRQGFSEADIESLTDVLLEFYARRPERDSLSQLQIQELRLCLQKSTEQNMYKTLSFDLKAGKMRSEMQWSIIALISHLTAMLDRFRHAHSISSDAGSPNSTRRYKKQQRPALLLDFLRRTDAPRMQLRIASLQVVVFRLAYGFVNESELVAVIEKFASLASDDHDEIANWAMLGLSW
jgi:serine-protein kinase ATM